MRRVFPAFLILIALAPSLSAFADVPMPAGHEAVAFAREAYQSMLAIDEKDAGFSDKALERFKALFDFDAFSARCLTDIKEKMTPEELARVKALFGEVFFANFQKNTDSLAKRRVAKPSYTFKTDAGGYQVVLISGASSSGNVSFAFYVAKSPDGYRMIDLDVDSVLLSRNWRGSFNRVHREKGVAGLMEKLGNRLKELGVVPESPEAASPEAATVPLSPSATQSD